MTALQSAAQQDYFTNITSTSIYAITDEANPMRTSTDAEVTAFLKLARSMNISVVLSPMLDPDWTLPTQLGCRSLSGARSRVDGKPNPGCYWRGQIGVYWPDDQICSSGEWSTWHDNYDAWILHWAALAESVGGVQAIVIAHELDRPILNCAARWAALVKDARAVYSGQVGIASGGAVFGADDATKAWVRSLSWLGYECYFGSSAPAPALPWEDAPLDDMKAGILKATEQVASFAASLGLGVVCTEGGWLAAPWASEAGWGNQFDQSDYTTHFLSIWGPAQALAYEATISVVESQPWYLGSFFWFWRADPTAGGLSDPSAIPWATEATAAIAKMWL